MNTPSRISFKIISLILLTFFLSPIPVYSKDEIRSPVKSIYLYDNIVVIQGRWKKTVSSSSKLLANINTVYLTCSKRSMACEENIAVLATPQDTPPGNTLYVLSTQYKIISWSNDIINARYEAPVAEFELKISVRDEFAERTFRETKARGSETANPNIYAHWVLE